MHPSYPTYRTYLNRGVASVVAVAGFLLVSGKAQEGIRYQYAKGEITAACDTSLAKARSRIDGIKAIDGIPTKKGKPSPALSFDQTFGAYDRIIGDLSDETSPLTFIAYVSTDADLRNEGSACEEKVGQYFPELLSDKVLYQILKRGKSRGADQKRLASETLRGFEKNGMNLDDAKLAQVTKLKQDLASLQAKFALNLNNDDTSVRYTADELKGVPQNFLDRLPKDPSGLYIVAANEANYPQVMQYATDANTRKRMIEANYDRAATENTGLLEQAISLRHQIAQLLGYKTWADAQLDGRMAKSSANVLDFLNGLKDKLKVREQQDLDKLLAYKKTLDPSATKVEAWDVNFLANAVKLRDYAVNEDLISEYFPSETVMKGLFDIYANLFGVRFEEVANAAVWADGVKFYRVYDKKSGELLAYFYKDLFPRDGKYDHAAAFPLISGRVTAGGKYSKPIAAIVANLTPPSGSKPSLLTHDDVETLFHEFGHIMHGILTRAPYSTLSGTSVAQDFVEAPSQMLENWVWNEDVLNQISGHYLDPSKKLPADLVQKMIAARNFNQGYSYMRQLLFALYDMDIHSQGATVDVTSTFDRMYRDILNIEPVQGGHFAASFGHLMGGYDAGYYGYLWSEVYAQDMFSRFQKDGLLNAKVGADYRRKVLAPGAMQDALDLLRSFLGREPNSDAFYDKLGIPH